MSESLVIRVSGPFMLAKAVEEILLRLIRELDLDDVKKAAACIEKEWEHRRLKITFSVEDERG